MTEATDPDELLLAFYGDDFTGSTDVLESLARNGVETLLFLDAPEPADVVELAGIDAVGVAGKSRTMSPGEMDEHLPPVFDSLARFDPELVHYKVCSTFDSAPEVGSIGHAIDLAFDRFDPAFVPVVVAAPSLEPRGRYVVFGNLFATVDGTTYRIDRHPTMSEHPVTPMTEADLTRHLAAQTDRPIGSVTLPSLESQSADDLGRTLDAVVAENGVVVFDGVSHDHQARVGRLVWEAAVDADDPLFSASSSGLNYALCRHWRESGRLVDQPRVTSAGGVDRIVAVSGSASPVTARQIEWALQNGFAEVALDTSAVVDPAHREAELERVLDASRAVLDDGGSPLVHSARGPEDPRLAETRERAGDLDIDAGEMATRIGRALGSVARELLEATSIDRVCVAGGDTSGHVAPMLDVYALEFLSPVGPGSPLCRARARTDRFDGVELALKGGQVQTTNDADDYFGVVRAGGDV